MTKKIMFCDRCGKEIEMQIEHTKYYVTKGPYYYDTCRKPMDLCDECNKDLEMFMEVKNVKSDDL